MFALDEELPREDDQAGEVEVIPRMPIANVRMKARALGGNAGARWGPPPRASEPPRLRVCGFHLKT